jgi:hypothetical protein
MEKPDLSARQAARKGFFHGLLGQDSARSGRGPWLAALLSALLAGYAYALALTRWLQARYGIRTRDVIGHAVSSVHVPDRR